MRDPIVSPRLLLLASIVLSLAPGGCGTSAPQILARQTTFDALEYAPYEGRGTAELSGQAVATTRGGVIYGAEDSVYVFPATHYTEEWWKRTLIEGTYLAEPDPRSLAFMRTTVADEQGRFRFRSLPAGDYYVVCIIRWKEELAGSTRNWDRYSTVPPLQVVNLGSRVRLEPHRSAEVRLEAVSKHRALVDPPPPGE